MYRAGGGRGGRAGAADRDDASVLERVGPRRYDHRAGLNLRANDLRQRVRLYADAYRYGLRLIIGHDVDEVAGRTLGDGAARYDDCADGARLGYRYGHQHAAAQYVAGIAQLQPRQIRERPGSGHEVHRLNRSDETLAGQ